MDLVSVVIPVYNVEKYLERCVLSVLNQEYSNLEVILVDDGSPDNCPKICDELAKKDARIKVIHKENGGVSSARNEGIMRATGKFITFIDSDDSVNQNFSNFLHYATALDYEVVVSNSLRNKNFKQNINYDNLTGEQVAKLLKADIPISCWGKLILRQFIIKNELFFKSGSCGEDLEWSIRTMCYANTLAVWADKFYNYAITETSVCGNKKFKYFSSLVDNIEEIFKVIELSNFGKKQKVLAKAAIVRNLYYNIAICSRYSPEDRGLIVKKLKENKGLLICPIQLKYKALFFALKTLGINCAVKLFSKMVR